MSKHTKGPWIHSKNGFNVLTNDSTYICEVYSISRDEQLANARLIAAAPDLLWALNQAIAHLANPQAFDGDELGKDWMALKERIEGR